MVIRWTPAALDDFKGISYYIEQDRNLETANRACRRIHEAIQNLRRQPQSGRPGFNEGTRELVVSPYIVVYRVMASHQAVQVLRIRHGAEDWRD